MNDEFGETFSRNIVGEYEPGYLDIKKEQYQKELAELGKLPLIRRLFPLQIRDLEILSDALLFPVLDIAVQRPLALICARGRITGSL